MAEGSSGVPKLGFYIGKEADYTCPGDNVTFEVAILEKGLCTITCSSTLSPSRGGTDSWKVEGAWVYYDDDEEIIVSITQEDPAGGPKDDRDVELALDEDGPSLKYKGTVCKWEKPPSDAWLEKHLAMTLKELKAEVIKYGFNPDGCIEKDDFIAALERGRASGMLKSPPMSPKLEKKDPPPTSPAVAKNSTPPVAKESSPQVSEPKPQASNAEAPSPEIPTTSASNSIADAPKDAPSEATSVPQEGTYTLEQLTDKRTWEKLDVKATERETYLPDSVFMELFGVSKDDFAKQPKWKRDNAKKKHGLF